MDLSEKQQLLQASWEKLSGYRTLQCGQSHENVVHIDKVDPALHERGHDDHPDWKIKIKGFCSRELRNSTLGCSHSMVQTAFNWEIQGLVAQGALESDELPMQEFNDTLTEIYLLDHRKGHVEKELAVLKQALPDTRQVVDEKAQTLLDMRHQHVQMINKLDAQHKELLSLLQIAMKRHAVE